MIRTHAFAKINLDLRVLGRRDDGYHEIRTLMQTVSLHDTLTFARRRRPGIVLRCRGASGLSEGPDNLVCRAAEAILSTCRSGAGVSITLNKRIPIGAGLGGGSSDCARTLTVLNRLFRVRLSASAVARMAGELGSDVPFFLHGGLGIAYGRGEKTMPVPSTTRTRVLIAAPRLRLATADVYRWFAGSGRTRRVPRPVRPDHLPYFCSTLAACRERDWSRFRNDLEGPVFERHPELHRIKRTLLDSSATHAQMTGSGSAVFGLFEDEQMLKAAAWRVRKLGCSCHTARFVNRTVCRTLA
ncbi:MAG: 4-(cytidine 5'-diphospho)-2-C-methyl-D-erythritol kinase [Acidobacteriota bacterium]